MKGVLKPVRSSRNELPLYQGPVVISKPWKVRYGLAAPVIGSLPQHGLIMNYISLSAPSNAIIIEYISLPLPCVKLIIQYGYI